jgi:glycine/D-amino acid oxidase-like deaminating enzyme
VTFTHDVIVLGRGLAGVVMSETLARRGLRVAVIDKPRAGRASWVATGIVNPIVLRRTLPSWRASELLAIAGAFYRDLEQRYQTRFWHPMPLVELFPTAHEAGIWKLRLKDPAIARLISAGPAGDPAVAELPQPYGHGVVQRSAWLDVRALMNAHEQRWMANGDLLFADVQDADIAMDDDGVHVHGLSAPLMIRCTGPFDTLPGLVQVGGEGLTVRLERCRLKTMVHRGIFLLPEGNDRFRVGATFIWEDVWKGPSEEGRAWLLDQLARVVGGPVEVLEHWAGVRPAARDRRPLLGRVAPNVAVLNGLGSRGVTLAPWCAEHLMGHLLDGAGLDPEADIARFQVPA